MEIVNSHRDITIDIVLTNVHEFDEGDYSNSTSLSIAWRAYQARKYVNTAKDIEYALAAFPDVNFRYIVRPKSKLSEFVPITFSNSKELIKKGKEDALELVMMKNSNGKNELQTILKTFN